MTFYVLEGFLNQQIWIPLWALMVLIAIAAVPWCCLYRCRRMAGRAMPPSDEELQVRRLLADGQAHPFDELERETGTGQVELIAKKRQKLYRLLEHLLDEGVITRDGHGYRLAKVK